MKVLYLPIKKKWFDMIRVGIKKEEYRDIGDYWRTRLENILKYPVVICVEFRNGYGKKAPHFRRLIKGIKIDYGKLEWGAKAYVKYYVIMLGEVVE